MADSARIDDETGLEGLPDIAVEIRSPSTWRYDIGAKRYRYEQQALPELRHAGRRRLRPLISARRVR